MESVSYETLQDRQTGCIISVLLYLELQYQKKSAYVEHIILNQLM
jgi:hypothetical protein